LTSAPEHELSRGYVFQDVASTNRVRYLLDKQGAARYASANTTAFHHVESSVRFQCCSSIQAETFRVMYLLNLYPVCNCATVAQWMQRPFDGVPTWSSIAASAV
jgi:hypothetical protein